MAGAAHDPAFAKKVGVPQSVAREFNQADKGTGIMTKGEKPRAAAYAAGGPVLQTSNSRFLKTEDEFRDERSNASDENWGKSGKGSKGKDKVTSIPKK
jgi:hypothetical protein